MGPVLIVGGDSLVGSTLARQCRAAGTSTDATSRRGGAAIPFDLARPDHGALSGGRWDAVYLCAAVTDMRACQNEPVATRRVNVDNTIELMRRLAAGGAHMVFFSTSQVFDGVSPAPAEDAVPNPRNEYGAQKLAVERAVARFDLPVAILRITKVVGERPTGVLGTWRRTLAGDGPIVAADNLALSPVAVADVGSLARRLAAGRHRGIWHFGAADSLGYVEAARLMAERVGQPAVRVRGEALTEAQVPSILRLGNERLACGKVESLLGIAPRPSREVLAELFARSL